MSLHLPQVHHGTPGTSADIFADAIAEDQKSDPAASPTFLLRGVCDHQGSSPAVISEEMKGNKMGLGH